MSSRFSFTYTDCDRRSCLTSPIHSKLVKVMVCVNKKSTCYYAIAMGSDIVCLHQDRFGFTSPDHGEAAPRGRT